jgi:PPOX class probable F420-dependent enzyme
MPELPDEVRALLSARNMAHVSTLMPDGGPQVAPVWIALEGDRLAIFSAAENLRIRNLRRDPRIAISILSAENPYQGAVIRGRVVQEIGGEEAVAIMDRMSRRYVGADFPMRTAIAMLIEPEFVKVLDLPFQHPSESPDPPAEARTAGADPAVRPGGGTAGTWSKAPSASGRRAVTIASLYSPANSPRRPS